jgi:hypothetical protein
MIEDDEFFISILSENHQINNIMHASANALLNSVDGPKVLIFIPIIIVHVYDSTSLTQQIIVLF